MGLRVAVCEDYLLVAWALRLLVVDAGHHVCGIASDPDTCIAMARVERPDIVLMDIRLAHGTCGVEAAGRLWAELRIRSVYTTAYRNDATQQDGVVGLLLKPYNRRDVCLSLEAVEAILSGREPDEVPPQLTLFGRGGAAAD